MVSTDGTNVDQPGSNGAEQDQVDQPVDENVVEGTSTAVAEVRPSRPTRKRKERVRRIDRVVMEFQPDAVELEHKKVPGGARWTLYVTLGLIVAVGWWSWWAKVDRQVVCEGELIPLEKPVLIQPIVTGRIVELHAEFNQIVRPGQVLATLDPTYSQADVDKYEKQKAGLVARIARLQAEIDGSDFDISQHPNDRNWELEKITFDARAAKMSAELKRLEAERKKILTEQEANEKSIAARQEVMEILDKQYETDRELAKNGTLAIREFQNSVLRRKNGRYELTQEINKRGEFVENLNVNEKTKEAFIEDTRAETSGLLVAAQQELNTVVEELKKASHAVKSSELRVPEDYGDVEFIVLQQSELAIGSVVEPGAAIYRLMPLDSEFEVKINIQGKDIARLRADRVTNPENENEFGDKVAVKLSSFPYQKHGTLEGQLRAISEGTFPLEQGMTKQMVYQGRIRLLTTKLNEVPEDFRLMPGMACTAEIKIGKRRVIEYFLYPLLRYLDSSIREP